MAMPRSSRRRGPSQRWLVIPFVVTILVLLVDASMHARSPRAATEVKTGAWEDTALSAVSASTAQGRTFAQLTTQRPRTTTQSVVSELDHLAGQASTTYRTMSKAAAPPSLQTAAGLLDAALLARRNGSAEMAAAAHDLLSGARPSRVLAEMSSATSDFQVGDSAYRMFSASRSLQMRFPSSQWTGPGAYSHAALSAFVQRLTSGVTGSQRRPLGIDAFSTNPAPLNLAGNVEVLSPAKLLYVTVDVSNAGRSELYGVTVTASLSPAYGSSGQQQLTTVNIPAGQAVAAQLPALSPQLSAVSTLTVTAVGPNGSPAQVGSSVRLVVPGPGFKGVPKKEQGKAPTTTTTAGGAAATTTVPTTTVPAGTVPAATTTVPATTVPTTTVPTTTVPATTVPTTTVPATTGGAGGTTSTT